MSRNRFEAFNHAENFEAFFQGWLVRQEHYLQELLQSVERIGNQEEDEARCKELIARVVAHYKQYYVAKSKVTQENVFLVLSPTWFSSFERSFFWIAGFKPGLVFQLVMNYVPDLSKEQWRRLEQLVAETGEEERELGEVVALVQENLAGPLVVEAARVAVDGEANHVDLVIARLRSAMEEQVECADYLRGKTVIKVMEILNAAQIVRFLAAFAHFHRTIRISGMQRDGQVPNLITTQSSSGRTIQAAAAAGTPYAMCVSALGQLARLKILRASSKAGFHESYCDELLHHVIYNHEGEEGESILGELVDRVMAHYSQYYKAKSMLTREQIFLVLSPTWLSPFERSFLWIGGLKPLHILELVTNSVLDLSEEQSRRIEQLTAETAEEERVLTEELVRAEGSLATPMVVAAAREAVDGQVTNMVVLIDRLRSTMEELVECADSLRGNTGTKVMEILTTVQKARFLAAFAYFDKITWTNGWQTYGSQLQQNA